MPNKIILKTNATANTDPSNGDLAASELGFNKDTGKLFVSSNGTDILEICKDTRPPVRERLFMMITNVGGTTGEIHIDLNHRHSNASVSFDIDWGDGVKVPFTGNKISGTGITPGTVIKLYMTEDLKSLWIRGNMNNMIQRLDYMDCSFIEDMYRFMNSSDVKAVVHLENYQHIRNWNEAFMSYVTESFPSFLDLKEATNIRNMFGSTRSAQIPRVVAPKVTDAWFYANGNPNLTSVSLELSTSIASAQRQMFDGCSSLQTAMLIGKSSNSLSLFYGCGNLTCISGSMDTTSSSSNADTQEQIVHKK